MREDLKEHVKSIISERITATVEELKGLAEDLKGELEYGYARKVLDVAATKSPQDVWIQQQLALCTYKDEELLPAFRFSRAMEILEKLGLCDPHKADAETLGLGGAVYKKKWEYDGQIENLYQALAFYRAAYERYPQEDKGYCGVNAAYILDILASRARTVSRRTGTPAVENKELERQATSLRERMASEVPKLSGLDPGLKDDYWYNVTVAEIFFGLGDYAEAGRWLARAGSLNPEEWKKRATFRQLVSLAKLRGCESPAEGSDRESWSPAWKALSEMLGDETVSALSCYRGKTGLALSGGGFRASFFHLGVLARMAEMDVLRSVEVLSTVSGGSIVGAHYYLELRHLLQARSDRDITREDYIEIVKRVQKDFLAGVQRNIRTRMFADFAANLRMILPGRYGLSRRLGELYERELYARIEDDHPKDRPRRMTDLLVTPKDWPKDKPFKPRYHNWRRSAKVPVLLVNATSLNTGHAWHFTARWMGEPPGLVGEEVDKNERCRRLYYHQAPEKELREYPLGYAVAASACVPGLFDPLVIDRLYPERTVRLVDGGVCDNQGVEGLLDEHCTLILCSDASGQMPDTPKPSGGLLGVLTRSSSIQGDRIREAEYQDLCGRLDTKALQGLFFIHLKKDLAVPPVDWIECDDPTPMPAAMDTKTPYGIDGPLQKRLAGIRTDLDSFSEVEANALMLSGYLMTDHQFRQLQRQYEKDEGKGKWGGFDINAERETDWPFLRLEPLMGQPESSNDLRRQAIARQLDASLYRVFKVWRLDPVLQKLGWALGCCTVLMALMLLWTFREVSVVNLTLGETAVALALVLAGVFFPVLNWLNPQRTSHDLVRKTVLAFLGYISAQLHIKRFDRRYLEIGSMDRLLEHEGELEEAGPSIRATLNALSGSLGRLWKLKRKRATQ